MDDDRKRLYDNFRNQIGLPEAESSFFDEDDLIDIYDYASDHSDDFTRMEVLFYAARHFPDSEQLQVRRDYFYYYLGYDEAVATRLERRHDKSTLARLLKMRQKAQLNEDGSARNPRSAASLERILDKAGTLDDEETIQFVTEASAPEVYPWFKENLDRIKAKVDYKPTLLYEAAYAAIDNADPEFAIKMAEELTMMEPFNPDFWELLTFAQMKAERIDDARSSVDYALALAPESPRSLAYKGRILTANDPYNREGADLLLKAFANPPSAPDFDDVKALAHPLITQGRNDELEQALAKRLADDPLNTAVIDGMLLILSEKGFEGARQYLANPLLPREAQFWEAWATRFIDSHNYNIAAYLLQFAAESKIIPAGSTILLEVLYMARRYEDVIRESPLKPGHAPGNPAIIDVAVVTILALMRMQRWDDARKLVNALSASNMSFELADHDSPRLPFSAEVLAQFGAATMLKALTLTAMMPTEQLIGFNLDDFDPFTYHSNN